MKFLHLVALIILFASSCTVGENNSKSLIKLPTKISADEITVKKITVTGSNESSLLSNKMPGKTIIENGNIEIFNEEGKRLFQISPSNESISIQTYYKNGKKAINMDISTDGQAEIWSYDQQGHYRSTNWTNWSFSSSNY
jgi:hypothetical protein